MEGLPREIEDDFQFEEALSNRVKCLCGSQVLNETLYGLETRMIYTTLQDYIALHPDRFNEQEREHRVFTCLNVKGCFVKHDVFRTTIDLNKTDCPTCKNTLEKIKDLGEDVQEYVRMQFYEIAKCMRFMDIFDDHHMDQVQRVERQLQNGDPVSTQDTHRFLESSINILQTAAYQPGLPIEIQAKLRRSTEILLLLKDFDLDVSVFKEANLEARNRQRKEHRDMFHIITNSNLGLQSLRMECTCC